MADLSSPITLVGLGRSGTTLLEKAFESIDYCYASGETGGIIFGTYAGAMHSYFNSEHGDYRSREDFAASITKKLFNALFPIDNPKYKIWFHKPAGIPKMINWERLRVDEDRTAFPTTWYWRTFNAVFPNAKYVAVLRNPWEIIASRVIFSGWPEDEGWDDIKVIYDIFEQNQQNIKFLFFDDLVAKPYEIISELFEGFGISVPAGLESITKEKFVPTDKSQFDMVINSLCGIDDPELMSSVKKLWSAHGKSFASPEGKVNFF